MRRKLLQLIIGATLVILFVVRCDGTPATTLVSEALIATATSATATLVPPTTMPMSVPPMATLTTVSLTATPTPILLAQASPTGGEVEGKLSGLSKVKVTLCNTIKATLPGQPAECIGDFEKSVMTDTTGHFVFSAISPGDYYIWFDIPEEQKDTALNLCDSGEYRGRDYLPTGEAREFCLDGKTLGPTVVVEAGKTTTYSPGP